MCHALQTAAGYGHFALPNLTGDSDSVDEMFHEAKNGCLLTFHEKSIFVVQNDKMLVQYQEKKESLMKKVRPVGHRARIKSAGVQFTPLPLHPIPPPIFGPVIIPGQKPGKSSLFKSEWGPNSGPLKVSSISQLQWILFIYRVDITEHSF